MIYQLYFSVSGEYEKIDYWVDNLSVLLEPLLIIILGLMVACLVIAMYLPIFKLGNVI